MKYIEFDEQNFIYAENQDEYLSLPAHKFNDMPGRVLFCAELSLFERIKVLFSGVIWHEVMTFDKPLQPQLLTTKKPIIQHTGILCREMNNE